MNDTTVWVAAHLPSHAAGRIVAVSANAEDAKAACQPTYPDHFRWQQVGDTWIGVGESFFVTRWQVEADEDSTVDEAHVLHEKTDHADLTEEGLVGRSSRLIDVRWKKPDPTANPWTVVEHSAWLSETGPGTEGYGGWDD